MQTMQAMHSCSLAIRATCYSGHSALLSGFAVAAVGHSAVAAVAAAAAAAAVL